MIWWKREKDYSAAKETSAMGNRILKESIITSRRVSNLTWFERVMFTNLIVTVDDYGVFYADPVLLSRMLFPRDPGVTEKMVREGLKHLEEQGLILRYAVEGEEYLKLRSWEKHQRLRNSRRKFPAPEEADEPPAGQEEAETPEETPPERPAEEETVLPAEPGEPEVRELPAAELPLNDNTVYEVTREEAEEYAALYPAVDIQQELRNMRGWCLANPQRRKTRSGIRKFINSWLARAQDRGKPGKTLAPEDNPFLLIVREEEEKRKRGQVS